LFLYRRVFKAYITYEKKNISLKLRHWGGESGPPRVTPSRGDTRLKYFLWLNLERWSAEHVDQWIVFLHHHIYELRTFKDGPVLYGRPFTN